MALFGPKYKDYLRFVPQMAADLEAQSSQDFDVLIYTQSKIVDELDEVFNRHAPHLSQHRRIILIDELDPGESTNNLTATYQRVDHFFKSDPYRYKYVAMLDPDDKIPRDYITVMINTIESTGADIIAADMWAFRENTNGHRTPITSTRFQDMQHIEFADILDCNPLGFSNTIVRQDMHRVFKGNYEDIGNAPNTLQGVPDWTIYKRAKAKGAKILITHQTHVDYRQHGINLLGNGKTDPMFLVPLQRDHHKFVVQEDWPDHYKKLEKDRFEIFNAIANIMPNGKPSAKFDLYARQAKQYIELLDKQKKQPLWGEQAPPFLLE
jgi:hypothetical protein